jgi:hypothetical protein
MSTFQELAKRHADAKFKKTALLHLIDYLDENFRASAGKDPKFTLTTDDKLPVPQEIFENITNDILLKIAQALENEINQIQSVTLAGKAEEKQQKPTEKTQEEKGNGRGRRRKQPDPATGTPAQVGQAGPATQPSPTIAPAPGGSTEDRGRSQSQGPGGQG